MVAYGAFEIQATKVKQLAQLRTPAVYYKLKHRLIAAIKNLLPDGGTDKALKKHQIIFEKNQYLTVEGVFAVG